MERFSQSYMGKSYSLGDGNVIANSAPFLVLLMGVFSSIVLIEPAPIDLLVIGCAGLLFLSGLRVPRNFLIPLTFLGIFLIGNFLSASFVPNPISSLIYAAVTSYLVLGLLLFACLMYYDYQRLMKYFWWGYIVASLIAVVTGFLGFFQLVPFYEVFLGNGRADGTFKDPNVYGPFLIPLILYLINSIEGYKGSKKIVMTGLMLFLVFGLFISFSRGAIANFLFSVVLMIAIKMKMKNSYQLFTKYVSLGSIAFISIVIAIGVAIATTDKLSHMFEERAKVLQDYDVEDGGRFSKQRLAIAISLGDPIGIGPGMGEEVMGLVPHNVYLLVLVENGIIGFIGWMGFFVYTLFYSYRFLKRQTLIPNDFLPIYAAIIGTVLESFIIDSIHWRHMYVLFGVLWGIMLAAERQELMYIRGSKYK